MGRPWWWGAPGYDGDALDQGAAYAFYALTDRSATGSSWLRASGSSGSGRLTAELPTGTTPSGQVPSEYLTADRFGSSVVVGGGRIVVGLPGYNGTLFDLGAVRTFTPGASVSVAPMRPNSTLPAPAEILSATSGQFGSETAYEPNSRTLFVAAPGDNKVGVYVNEGLSWRWVENLAPPSGSGTGVSHVWRCDRSGRGYARDRARQGRAKRLFTPAQESLGTRHPRRSPADRAVNSVRRLPSRARRSSLVPRNRP